MRAVIERLERGNRYRSRRGRLRPRGETAGGENRHFLVAIALDVIGELPQVLHHDLFRLFTSGFGVFTAIQSRRDGVRIGRDVVPEGG